MTLVYALGIGVLFGTGAYLVLSRDLVRVVLGVAVISHASVLTLIASGLTRGRAAIYPLDRRIVSDPLSQAMALTAIVIGLAVTALLLALAMRVVIVYRSQELDDVVEEEVERDERLEREDAGEHAQEEAAAQ
jgi:multicomponent Na+:H+ antiporter subunit C